MSSHTIRDPARPRGPAAAQGFVRIDIARCHDKAAACERTARRLRDPAARRIYARAARCWRAAAEQSVDELPDLIRLLARMPRAGE
jgi:hypothetical protein